MPYAIPSPSSSPVTTMTFMPPPPSPKSSALPPPSIVAPSLPSPRREDQRPPRHHQRSHSSEPIASTSSFIFVQPSTPEGERSRTSSSSSAGYTWSPGSAASPGQQAEAYATIPRQQRRIRLSAFTPAGSPAGGKKSPGAGPGSSSSSSGPSSQEESSDGPRGRKEGAAAGDDDLTPRATAESFFTNQFPFGPNSSSPAPSPTVEDDEWAQKPALMVRKKSGELVRPSLKADTSRRDFSKPRSAPATPTCPKYVHFDTQLEHVKHFLAQQRPAAVSRSGSPVETETEDEPEAFPFPAMATAQAGTVKLVLPNFPPPSSRLGSDCYVESLNMTSDGKSIRGVVHVQNLAFEKWVAVRFTLDNWQTVSEVSAEHHESLPGGKSDRFAFVIRLQDLLARIEEKTMFLAVRYTVGGKEIWDNNDNQNYRIEFKRMPPPPAAIRAAQAQAANAAASRAAAASAAERRKNAWSVTNAGQAADRMADLRRELDRLVREDNFDDDDDNQQPTSAAVTGASAMGLGIGAGRNGRLGPDGRSYSEGAPNLSGRYDFGNSLKMYQDKGGMKERPAGSPSLNVPLPLPPNSSGSFFDPVSTSPSRPRAPPLPNVRAPPSPPKPYQSYESSLPASIINSHRSESPLGSPRPHLQPDFGLRSTSNKPAPASGQPQSEAYFSPTAPSFQVPRSPPRDGSSAAAAAVASYFYPGSPSGSTPTSYLPLQDVQPGQGGFGNGAPRTRYHSYPVGGAKQPDSASSSLSSTSSATIPGPPSLLSRTSATPYSPLVPPAFRDGRSRNSPFASPAPSPPTGVSPAASPPGSSHVKLRSPPPERVSVSDTDSDNDPPQLWSPATTDSTSSTASSSSSNGTLRHGSAGGISPFMSSRAGRRDGSEDSNASSLVSSPESDVTSVPPDSPGYGGGMPLPAGEAKTLARPSNALEFSNFLDRYRFHLNAAGSTSSQPGSSLGLSAPASLLSAPQTASPTDFFSFAASSPGISSPVPISGADKVSPSSSTATSMAGSPTPPRRLSPLAASVSPGLPPVSGTTIVS
ncbi:hypothetical protein JCM8547_008681 [Rhodosporidiobolus lusitaniae]